MDNHIRSNNLLRRIEPLIIVVFWLLLFASPFLLANNEYRMDWQQIYSIWKSFVPYLLIFLINRFFLLPYLFLRNKRVLFLGSAAMLILIGAFGIYQFQRDMQPAPNRMNRTERSLPPGDAPAPGPRNMHKNPGPPPPQRMPPYIVFILVSILIVGFDTGLKLSVLWVRSEQKRVNTEKENMEMQLAFLRNQVSPHFFMNTLNNIHSLIDYNSEEAKESIIRLSKLMRHLLYDSEAEKIPIQKEIDFISNYVDLMKMRYSDKVSIKLHLPSKLPNKSIPPLLFTSYVENAFKHGISYRDDSFIDIKFLFTKDSLRFEIRNSDHASEKENRERGIGIENSGKRLDLIYGDSYSLRVEDNNNEFKVELTIPI